MLKKTDLYRNLLILGMVILLVSVVGCKQTIHMAASSGDIEMLTQFLDDNPQLINKQDSYGMTAMHWAVDKHERKIIDLLIKRNADLNIKDKYKKTPLEHAIDKNHRRVAMTLILNGADLPKESDSPAYNKQKIINNIKPLHLVVREGDLEKVKEVISRYPEQVNVKDDSKRIPLYWAARANHVDIVRLLIEKGSEVNAKTEDGWTALHTSAYNGRLEAATLLIELGATVDIRNDEGETPLYWAARNGRLGVVKLLLANRADAHAKTKRGNTPISQAKTSQITELLKGKK